MQYIITEQYDRGEEQLLGEFLSLYDAHFYMSKKLAFDDDEGKHLIYRIYDDSDLLQEINKANLFVTYSKYADGHDEVNQLHPFRYHVMEKPVSASQRKIIANFQDKHDATLFIMSKFESDKTIDDLDLFFIFKDKVLVDTLNREKQSQRNRIAANSNHPLDQTVFHPTPMPMSPKPQGFPSDHWTDEEENDKT